MIKWIKIINYKGINNGLYHFSKNNIIIGQNDSGKTTILECIKILFEDKKIDINFINNKDKDVRIIAKIEDNVYKKIFKTDGKLDTKTSNFNFPEDIAIVLIPANNIDIITEFKKILEREIIAKSDVKLIEKMKKIMESVFNDVINSIDQDFFVLNNNDTSVNLKVVPDWKKAFSIEQKEVNDIPVIGRGSGYQKNFLLSLLTSMLSIKVILLVDEIENSFSNIIIENLLKKIDKKCYQFICTTHNTKVLDLSKKQKFKIIYKYSNGESDELDVIKSLDNSKGGKFILLEGKTDIPYIESVLEYNKSLNEYIILAAGGAGNLKSFGENIKKQYGSDSKITKIYDGDQREKIEVTNEVVILSNQTIEYYNSEENIKKIMGDDFNDQEYKKQKLLFKNIWKDELSLKFNEDVNQIKQLSDEIIKKIN